MSQFSTPTRANRSGFDHRVYTSSTQVLKLGKDHIVSFAGTSQFTAQGVSACGLAAFNFARIGFRIEHGKRNLSDILSELSTRDVIEVSAPHCAVTIAYMIPRKSWPFAQDGLVICISRSTISTTSQYLADLSDSCPSSMVVRGQNTFRPFSSACIVCVGEYIVMLLFPET